MQEDENLYNLDKNATFNQIELKHPIWITQFKAFIIPKDDSATW